MESSIYPLHGFCDPRFDTVKEAFARSFQAGKDIRASCAVTIDEEFVIDIWAGYSNANQTRPWTKNTIVNVWSATKVMTTLCAHIHILVDRGLLDLDAPVAKYWPEFGQAGKAKLPVRYLLSHMSGVAGWDQPISVKDL